MFSVRVHLPDKPGHTVHECSGYEVVPHGGNGAITIKMMQGDAVLPVDLPDGGIAFVMGDSGKTVEVIRTHRSAALRGVR